MDVLTGMENTAELNHANPGLNDSGISVCQRVEKTSIKVLSAPSSLIREYEDTNPIVSHFGFSNKRRSTLNFDSDTQMEPLPFLALSPPAVCGSYLTKRTKMLTFGSRISDQ